MCVFKDMSCHLRLMSALVFSEGPERKQFGLSFVESFHPGPLKSYCHLLLKLDFYDAVLEEIQTIKSRQMKSKTLSDRQTDILNDILYITTE